MTTWGRDERIAREKKRREEEARKKREEAYFKTFDKPSVDYRKRSETQTKAISALNREKASLREESARARAELEKLKKKKAKKNNGNGSYATTTTKRKRRKVATKPKKIGFFSPYVFGKKIKKKKQGRPLSRKRPIRL